MDKDFLLSLELSEETAQAILDKHQAVVGELTFQSQLREAVQAAGGRSVRAIGAMLELDAIRSAQEPAKALEQALRQLKAESGYLFSDAPPPYAREPGTREGTPIQKPVTLAGAIRQKYERK